MNIVLVKVVHASIADRRLVWSWLARSRRGCKRLNTSLPGMDRAALAQVAWMTAGCFLDMLCCPMRLVDFCAKINKKSVLQAVKPSWPPMAEWSPMFQRKSMVLRILCCRQRKNVPSENARPEHQSSMPRGFAFGIAAAIFLTWRSNLGRKLQSLRGASERPANAEVFAHMGRDCVCSSNGLNVWPIWQARCGGGRNARLWRLLCWWHRCSSRYLPDFSSFWTFVRNHPMFFVAEVFATLHEDDDWSAPDPGLQYYRDDGLSMLCFGLLPRWSCSIAWCFSTRYVFNVSRYSPSSPVSSRLLLWSSSAIVGTMHWTPISQQVLGGGISLRKLLMASMHHIKVSTVYRKISQAPGTNRKPKGAPAQSGRAPTRTYGELTDHFGHARTQTLRMPHRCSKTAGKNVAIFGEIECQKEWHRRHFFCQIECQVDWQNIFQIECKRENTR